MKRITSALVAASLITGCASMGEQYLPLVDRPGPDYANDLRECQRYAEGEANGAQAGAGGAILGALFTLAVSAALGAGTDSETAIAGAIGGGLGGFTGAQQNQRQVIVNCLAGRGYRVLR